MFLKRANDWIIILMSSAILAGVAYGIWSDLIDGRIYNPVLEFGSRFTGPTHITTKQVYAPGEMVYARVAFQKQRCLTGTIQWSLIDHVITQFAPRTGSLPVGVFDAVVPVERIPYDATKGERWFAGTVSYKVNWLSTLSYPVWTNKIEVK